MDKNNAGIVVACPIKNDNEYLIEFTEHYLNLGFDKIYFYDNNDDDNINPREVLVRYIQNNQVEVINYRNVVFNDIWLRRDFFSSYDFNWVLFADDDEFLELKRDKNIKCFLDSFDKKVQKIAINNLHYGDNENYYYEDKPVQDRFPIPLPLDSGTENYKFNCAVKSLLKKIDMQNVESINAHTLINNKPYYGANNKIINMKNFWRMDERDVTYDIAFLKHYCTKSVEEFVKCKIKRGSTNNLGHKGRFDIDSYYYMYNSRTEKKISYSNYF